MSRLNGAPLPYINTAAYETPTEFPRDVQMHLDRAREAYTMTLNDVLQAICEDFPLHHQKQLVAQDFLLFTLFLTTLKIVELAGQPIERRQLLSALSFLLKRGEREVPEQLLAFLKTYAPAGALDDDPA